MSCELPASLTRQHFLPTHGAIFISISFLQLMKSDKIIATCLVHKCKICACVEDVRKPGGWGFVNDICELALILSEFRYFLFSDCCKPVFFLLPFCMPTVGTLQVHAI